MNRSSLFVISVFAALTTAQAGIAMAQNSGQSPAVTNIPSYCYDSSGNLAITEQNRAECSQYMGDNNNPDANASDPNTGSIDNNSTIGGDNNLGTGTGAGGTGTDGSGSGTNN